MNSEKTEKKTKEKNRKGPTVGTRVSKECSLRLDTLNQSVQAKSQAELVRIILEHAVGLKNNEALPDVAGSIRKRLAAEQAAVSTAAAPDESIALLKDVQTQLKNTNHQLRNIGDFYQKKFTWLADKIDDHAEDMNVRLDRHEDELRKIRSLYVGIGTAMSKIHERVEMLIQFFNQNFITQMKTGSAEIIETFISKFFSRKREDDAARKATGNKTMSAPTPSPSPKPDFF